ncbi:TauD/TfdA family dioxygenase [Chryseobacterium sp. SIMBA_029]|uniref:TauD/TfdA family dioxygenase n=1 Tax=Chryseobacterium sp. SIMBA_029 TaxID=3085772 RepID=UPI00397A0D3D
MKINKLNSFNSVSLDLKNINPVDITYSLTTQEYPVVFTAKEKYLLLHEWITLNKNLVKENLYKYGAILFRNFNSDIAGNSFKEIVANYVEETIEYDLGAGNRSKVIDNIYISTFHPKEEDLEMHNEMSYTSFWPKEIMFYCETPSLGDGATPLCDGRKIWNLLKPETKKKFTDLSIMYVRKLGGMFGGQTWQMVFDTDDKTVAEKKCAENNIDFEWQDNDVMVMKWIGPVTVVHPVTQEICWFNHCYFFNSIMLNNDMKTVLTIQDIPFYCYYGDGSAIEIETLMELKDVYEKTKSCFLWEKGDLLLVDNILISHGRNSFKGERKVLVAMFKK